MRTHFGRFWMILEVKQTLPIIWINMARGFSQSEEDTDVFVQVVARLAKSMTGPFDSPNVWVAQFLDGKSRTFLQPSWIILNLDDLWSFSHLLCKYSLTLHGWILRLSGTQCYTRQSALKVRTLGVDQKTNDSFFTPLAVKVSSTSTRETWKPWKRIRAISQHSFFISRCQWKRRCSESKSELASLRRTSKETIWSCWRQNMRPTTRTERTGTGLNQIYFKCSVPRDSGSAATGYPHNLEDVVVIAIDSTMSADEIKQKVADHLHDNKARYCEVLKKKGYPESQARKLLTLMISFFSN